MSVKLLSTLFLLERIKNLKAFCNVFPRPKMLMFEPIKKNKVVKEIKKRDEYWLSIIGKFL